MVVVPAAFARQIQTLRGEAGAAWIEALPQTIEDLAERWDVTLGAPFDLSFNFVCRARLRDGTEAVFKIG
ncbi:MAG: aminoglycoside/hydroxyurea antibiotic resistance kinase, partial [Actinomycetes bacterium]